MGQMAVLGNVQFTGTAPWRITYAVHNVPSTAATAAGAPAGAVGKWFAPKPTTSTVFRHIEFAATAEVQFAVRADTAGDFVFQVRYYAAHAASARPPARPPAAPVLTHAWRPPPLWSCSGSTSRTGTTTACRSCRTRRTGSRCM